MSGPPETPFRLRSVAASAYGPSLLYGFSQGVIAPVIAISAIDRGATVAVAGLVVSLMGIGSIVSNIPAGVMTTRFGERRSMVAAAAISAAGIALCLADVGLGLFSAGVLAMGMASAVFQLARQSYLTEVVPLNMRARAMSTLGGVQRIGAFAGPFAGACVVFYPAGLAMDRWGRRAVAVPCTLVMGLSFIAMPLTHGAIALGVAAVVMGIGNGIGSGIVNTLGADVAPVLGRPTFLGVWRELADGGAAIGPVILSAVTAVAGLAAGIVVSGVVGLAAAATLFRFVPTIRRRS
jgi:MFS family permease